MHIVTVTQPITKGAYALAVGSYLADNVNAGELLARNPTILEVQPAPNPAPISAIDLDSGVPRRLLIIRAGGYGDLLFLTPVLRAIKQFYPKTHIAVATFPSFGEILANNPDVDEIVSYPVELTAVEKYDAVIPLENTIESEREMHAVDRLFTEFDIPPQLIAPENKQCLYYMTDAERNGAMAMFPAKFNDKVEVKPRLGVQVVASAMCRSYSHDLLAQACEMLHRKGWEIFFFGDPKAVQIPESDGIVNLTLRSLTIRQSAAVLATCDVVLAPDSVLAHLAGALDLPCVALYGPFPWEMRTSYHPKTMALTGNGNHACAPCFHHGNSRQHFPAHGPCAKTGRCEVLAAIKPGRIAAKVDALYKASLQIAEEQRKPRSTPPVA